MSAVGNILALVTRQKLAEAEAAAFRARREALIAAARGEAGSPGTPGEPGAPGRAPKHQWQGTRLRFQNPDNTWGEWVELRGEPGKTRVSGGWGSATSAFDPTTLPQALDDPKPAELLVQQNGTWARASWAQYLGWVSQSLAEYDNLLTEYGESLITENDQFITQE